MHGQKGAFCLLGEGLPLQGRLLSLPHGKGVGILLRPQICPFLEGGWQRRLTREVFHPKKYTPSGLSGHLPQGGRKIYGVGGVCAVLHRKGGSRLSPTGICLLPKAALGTGQGVHYPIKIQAIAVGSKGCPARSRLPVQRDGRAMRAPTRAGRCGVPYRGTCGFGNRRWGCVTSNIFIYVYSPTRLRGLRNGHTTPTLHHCVLTL